MEQAKLNFWRQEAQHTMTGWNFAHLDGRWQNDSLPWDYQQLVLQYLQP